MSKLPQSGFFLVALSLHLIALILLGGWVIATKIIPPPDPGIPDVFLEAKADGAGLVAPPPPSDLVPKENLSPDENTSPDSSPTINTGDLRDIIKSDSIKNTFQLPEPGISSTLTENTFAQENSRPQNPIRPPNPQVARKPINSERLSKIRERIGESSAGKGYDMGKTELNGVTGVQATFTCYIAQYQGGDWDHNVKLSADGKRITYGAIPNLMTQMTRWNKRLKAQVEGVPLNLSDREALFQSKPPVAFIYFSGHKDFRLTDEEVNNLRDFIIAGGVIWGDAGMPGAQSRFDIAFRREMNRVLPDADQEFQPIDDQHEIFRQKGSLIKTTPSGINYAKNPIDVKMVGDQIGVIYTLNSYGNLWQVALDPNEKILEVYDEGSGRNPNETYTNRALWSRRDTYYRNVNRDTVLHAYQLGMNIVVHLLLQYQDALKKAPRS